MASSYHQLGIAAQHRGRPEQAEDWYGKSLAIDEELGNRPGMASSYGQLGLLAEARQQPRQALEWIIRCVTVFGEFPHPSTAPGPHHLARLTAQHGEQLFDETWKSVTGWPVPDHVWVYVRSGHQNSEGQERSRTDE